MKRFVALAVLLLCLTRPAHAQSVTYAGCYSDAFVSTCLTVPYTISPDPAPGINVLQGGPITFQFLNLSPSTLFIPIYQGFPALYAVIDPFSMYIDPSVGFFLNGFEAVRAHESALPPSVSIRFAEIHNCPNTGQFQLPYCNGGDPGEGPFGNEFVTSRFVALTAIPEPSTITLVAIGLALVACVVYRKVT